MSTLNRLIILALISVLLFLGCSGGNNSSSSVPKDSRLLGIDILDTTPSSSFGNNVSLAQSAGASYMILNLGWNQIESAPTPTDCSQGTYTDPYGALATFNAVLPANNIKLSLSIVPISTSINLMPADMASKNLNDPLVICRFNKMLDFVFSKIPNVSLTSMQFGNEIDLYSAATNTTFWSQYWTFYTQVSAYSKTVRPGLSTSVIGSLYGAIGQSQNSLAQGGLQQLWNASDIVMVTYYPLHADLSVKSPSVVSADIGSLVNLYPTKAISFNEIGYPSGSSYVGSSQTMQQQFVQQVFTAWDVHAARITSMNFLRLNDYSSSAAQTQAAIYSMGTDSKFIEYLQTLGLRTYGGADKLGFTQLKVETAARSW